MSKINRILLILFIIVTFGIFIEAGYYIMVVLPKKSLQNGKDLIVTETSEKKSNSSKIAELIDTNISYDEALYLRNVLSMHFEKKLLSDLEISTTLKGIVESVDTKGGYLDPKTPYQLAVYVKVPNSTKPLPVFYTQKDLANLIITRSAGETGGAKTEITDLKRGDNISIKETYNLVDFRLVKGEISILN